jgi:hypothetical protein
LFPAELIDRPRGTIFPHMKWLSLFVALALRAIVNPPLARDLMTVAWRFRRRDWLSHAPFLPLPSKEYVAWRMYTAFGNHRAVPSVDDMIRYARWARRGA